MFRASLIVSAITITMIAGRGVVLSQFPDNSRIVYTLDATRYGNSFWWITGDGRDAQLLGVGVDGGRVYDVACAPDGVTFIALENGISLINIQTGENTYHPLRSENNFLRGVDEISWSRSGGSVAIVTPVDRGLGPVQIYTANPDWSNLRQVTTSEGSSYAPTWSRDDTQLAFASNRTGTTQIYLINVDGSNERQLTSGEYFASGPDWSPAADVIAFYGLTPNDHAEIFRINTDGTGLTQLTFSERGDNLFPIWSPDGTQIAFTSDRDGQFDLYVMNADGSNVRRLTNDVGYEIAECWLPEARVVVQAALSFPGRPAAPHPACLPSGCTERRTIWHCSD